MTETNKDRELVKLKRYADHIGHTPSREDIRTGNQVGLTRSVTYYHQKFGSLKNAIISAGLPVRPHGQKVFKYRIRYFDPEDEQGMRIKTWKLTSLKEATELRNELAIFWRTPQKSINIYHISGTKTKKPSHHSLKRYGYAITAGPPNKRTIVSGNMASTTYQKALRRLRLIQQSKARQNNPEKYERPRIKRFETNKRGQIIQ